MRLALLVMLVVLLDRGLAIYIAELSDWLLRGEETSPGVAEPGLGESKQNGTTEYVTKKRATCSAVIYVLLQQCYDDKRQFQRSEDLVGRHSSRTASLIAHQTHILQQ